MTCIADIRCAYDGHMETNTTFSAATICGIPTAWLETELETTDVYGTPVVIDEFWHNGSGGIMASGYKFRKDGQRMKRRIESLRVAPPQDIADALNALEARMI